MQTELPPLPPCHFSSGLWWADAHVGCRKVDLAQEHEQGGDEGQHRRHEKHRDRYCEAGADEERDNHAADQQRAQGA